MPSLYRGKKSHCAKIVSFIVCFAFLSNLILPAPGFAQMLQLSDPGTMVPLSTAYQPAIITGIQVHPDNPLEFDFIVNGGDDALDGDALRAESEKMIRYFLASLTTPEEDLWVNLSPYEEDRIVADDFGKTEMGRDMLAQDYLLKQITASLIYPEDELGKKFWEKVYKKAYEAYGTTEIPVNTFNKVWIMPDKVAVYEHDNMVFVAESSLKVMLEEDYVALQRSAESRALEARDVAQENQQVNGEKYLVSSKNQNSKNHLPDAIHSSPNNISTQIIREIVIPELEKEVNFGRNFAPLRQIYHSLILAAWFKQAARTSLLGQAYVDRNKTKGIDLVTEQEGKDVIYQKYLEAYKQGAYNYIKAEYDPYTNKNLPRKYFSGGIKFSWKGLFGKLKKITNVFLATKDQKNNIVRTTENNSDVKVVFTGPTKVVGAGNLPSNYFRKFVEARNGQNHSPSLKALEEFKTAYKKSPRIPERIGRKQRTYDTPSKINEALLTFQSQGVPVLSESSLTPVNIIAAREKKDSQKVSLTAYILKGGGKVAILKTASSSAVEKVKKVLLEFIEKDLNLELASNYNFSIEAEPFASKVNGVEKKGVLVKVVEEDKNNSPDLIAAIQLNLQDLVNKFGASVMPVKSDDEYSLVLWVATSDIAIHSFADNVSAKEVYKEVEKAFAGHLTIEKVYAEVNLVVTDKIEIDLNEDWPANAQGFAIDTKEKGQISFLKKDGFWTLAQRGLFEVDELNFEKPASFEFIDDLRTHLLALTRSEEDNVRFSDESEENLPKVLKENFSTEADYQFFTIENEQGLESVFKAQSGEYIQIVDTQDIDEGDFDSFYKPDGTIDILKSEFKNGDIAEVHAHVITVDGKGKVIVFHAPEVSSAVILPRISNKERWTEVYKAVVKAFGKENIGKASALVGGGRNEMHDVEVEGKPGIFKSGFEGMQISFKEKGKSITFFPDPKKGIWIIKEAKGVDVKIGKVFSGASKQEFQKIKDDVANMIDVGERFLRRKMSMTLYDYVEQNIKGKRIVLYEMIREFLQNLKEGQKAYNVDLIKQFIKKVTDAYIPTDKSDPSRPRIEIISFVSEKMRKSFPFPADHADELAEYVSTEIPSDRAEVGYLAFRPEDAERIFKANPNVDEISFVVSLSNYYERINRGFDTLQKILSSEASKFTSESALAYKQKAVDRILELEKEYIEKGLRTNPNSVRKRIYLSYSLGDFIDEQKGLFEQIPTQKIIAVANKAYEMGFDEVVLCDTANRSTTQEIYYKTIEIQAGTEAGRKIAHHIHTVGKLGSLKAMAALGTGSVVIDASILHQGGNHLLKKKRMAGNMPTEDLAFILDVLGAIINYNIPKLFEAVRFAREHFDSEFFNDMDTFKFEMLSEEQLKEIADLITLRVKNSAVTKGQVDLSGVDLSDNVIIESDYPGEFKLREDGYRPFFIARDGNIKISNDSYVFIDKNGNVRVESMERWQKLSDQERAKFQDPRINWHQKGMQEKIINGLAALIKDPNFTTVRLDLSWVDDKLTAPLAKDYEGEDATRILEKVFEKPVTLKELYDKAESVFKGGYGEAWSQAQKKADIKVSSAAAARKMIDQIDDPLVRVNKRNRIGQLFVDKRKYTVSLNIWSLCLEKIPLLWDLYFEKVSKKEVLSEKELKEKDLVEIEILNGQDRYRITQDNFYIVMAELLDAAPLYAREFYRQLALQSQSADLIRHVKQAARAQIEKLNDPLISHSHYALLANNSFEVPEYVWDILKENPELEWIIANYSGTPKGMENEIKTKITFYHQDGEGKQGFEEIDAPFFFVVIMLSEIAQKKKGKQFARALLRETVVSSSVEISKKKAVEGNEDIQIQVEKPFSDGEEYLVYSTVIVYRKTKKGLYKQDKRYIIKRRIDEGADITAGILAQEVSTELSEINTLEDIIKRFNRVEDQTSLAATRTGGIDLTSIYQDLNIKTDGKGTPLPIEMQNLEQIQIDGLVPIIINIVPIPQLPQLLGFQDFEEQNTNTEIVEILSDEPKEVSLLN